MQTSTLYDQDFHAWTEQQVTLLRIGCLDELLDLDQLPQSCPFTEAEIFQEPIV